MSEPLSPAAQAVLQAITEISPAPAGEIAAAALRAMAKQSCFADVKVGLTSEVITVDHILAIANELEGVGQ